MEKIKTLALSLLIFGIMVQNLGCSNDINTPQPTGVIQKAKIDILEIKDVSQIDEDFINFTRSESFEILKKSTPNFEFTKIQSVRFNNVSVRGLIISLPNRENFERDIMVVFKTENSKSVTSFLREKIVKISILDGKESYTGEVNWFRADNTILNEMKVKDNKITHFKLHTSSELFTLQNAKISVLPAGGCTWQCTAQDFNCEYQAAKKTCDEDFLCSLACSFNPCFVAYVAAAVLACTVCD